MESLENTLLIPPHKAEAGQVWRGSEPIKLDPYSGSTSLDLEPSVHDATI